jgi:predicted transcriptional regulator
MKIFEYIKKLDESGNYRLADKLDNEIRKIYAQAVMQTPNMQGDHMLTPYFAKQLNDLLVNNMTKKEDTDTLSPSKNTDIATIRKQVNKIISDGNITSKKIKTIENDLGALPALEGKVGQTSEFNDSINTKITDITNNVAENTQDIQMLQEINDTLE